MKVVSVLIQEKDLANALGLKAFLYKRGFSNVKFVSTFNEAIINLNINKPQIILVDPSSNDEYNLLNKTISEISSPPVSILIANKNTVTIAYNEMESKVYLIEKPYNFETIETILKEASDIIKVKDASI